MTTQTAYKKSSFGPAFLFLSKKRREALAVYYAFCRLMDDIADEPEIKDKAEQLVYWKQEITRVFEGTPETALGKEIQQMSRDFAIPADRFLLLIEGMQADVQAKTYATVEELEWYLWRVAGIVGQATLDILGVKGPKATKLARALGFAVQLTNIVRDVREDACLGRVYIPLEMLQRHEMDFQSVLQAVHTQQLAPVLAELAKLSYAYYAQAEQIMRTLPTRKMLPCRVMGFVYRKNLAKIEKTGFVFDKAIKLSKFEKIRCCIYAVGKTTLGL